MSARVSELTLTRAGVRFERVFFRALGACLLAEVASVPPQLHLISDKPVHCFLGNNLKKEEEEEARFLGLKHSKKPDPAPCRCGSAGFDTICHLVALP